MFSHIHSNYTWTMFIKIHFCNNKWQCKFYSDCVTCISAWPLQFFFFFFLATLLFSLLAHVCAILGHHYVGLESCLIAPLYKCYRFSFSNANSFEDLLQYLKQSVVVPSNMSVITLLVVIVISCFNNIALLVHLKTLFLATSQEMIQLPLVVKQNRFEYLHLLL